MDRLLALLLVVAPILLAGYGVGLMRDALFGQLIGYFPSLHLQFGVGLMAFIAGVSAIGGFIYHKDQKRKKVAPRFLKRKRKHG